MQAAPPVLPPFTRQVERDHDALGRPRLDRGLWDVIAALSRLEHAELGHVRAENILLIAGAARRDARASIRTFSGTFKHEPTHSGVPLDATKPRVQYLSQPIFYELCFRPIYFLASTPDQRFRSLVHELLHIDSRFDGTLDPRRSHRSSSRFSFDDAITRVAEAWSRCPELASLFRVFEFSGEARMLAWTDRPPSRLWPRTSVRTEYTERDLHLCVVSQTNGTFTARNSTIV